MIKNIIEIKKITNIKELKKIKLESDNNEEFIICSRKNIIAYLAKYAIEQSPYLIPDKLLYVLTKTYNNLEEYFVANREIEDFVSFKNKKVLYDLLQNTLFSIAEFKNWNISKNNNNSEFNFISMYSRINPDNDFIDLYALIDNIINALYFDTREL